MPKGERRSRKVILESQIQVKQDRIDGLNNKITQLQSDIEELNAELTDIIQAENRAIEEANDKELLDILKKHNVSKERLLDMLQDL